MTHSPCLLEHTVPGRHLDGCPVDGCPGCRPAYTDGESLVCQWHTLRHAWAIAAAPDLVSHLRDHVTPGAASGDRVGGSREAPAPLNVHAVTAADSLHSLLADWAVTIVETHPSGLRGPDWTGSDVRPASKRSRVPGLHTGTCRRCSCLYVAGARGPHTSTCTRCPGCATVYDPPRVAGVKDRKATLRVARWLLIHHAWSLQQPWAGEYITDVTDRIADLRATWPVEERAARLPRMPCPACDRVTLVRHAPRWAGAPVTIICDQVDCSHVIQEQHFEFLARLAAEELTAS